MSVRVDATAGKAAVLQALSRVLQGALVPDGVAVDWATWRFDPRRARRAVHAACGRRLLVVRSARQGEDRSAADAGRYLSVLGVRGDAALAAAVARVFASYGSCADGDAVLVQPQVPAVRHALVASCRGAYGSAYDAVSIAAGSTPSAITAGEAPAETWQVLRGSDGAAALPPLVRRTLALLAELRGLVGANAFEVELVEAAGVLWLLQLRPLPTAPVVRGHAVARRRAEDGLRAARSSGAVLLGLMPDWNPAELLGAHPRPLALSLFAATIGDGSWYRARMQLGYAAPYRRQLLRPLAGRPWVDVRASFESLLPAAIPPGDRQRLLRAALARLRAQPQLHDRVEFEVVPSGLTFDCAARLAALGAGVRRAPVVEALRALTARALDAVAMAREQEAFTRLFCVGDAAPSALPVWLPWIRDRIALPFARAARRDFLASALWRSAVALGAISAERCLEMLAGLAGAAPGGGNPLRPGQFEISSGVHAATGWAQPNADAGGFRLHSAEHAALARLLGDSRLPWTPAQLVQLGRAAARGRELGKQALAAHLGAWLEALARAGAARGLDREVLGWLRWNVACAAVPVEDLADRAVRARQRHHEDALLQLPVLLDCLGDLRAVRLHAANGHFLGGGAVEGPLVVLRQGSGPAELPAHAIVAIHNADPGYDWVFAHSPRALVTAYGGPHSHMALRCAHVRCGAVLGLGAERFERLVRADWLRIDFDQQRIECAGSMRRGERLVA